MGFMGGFLVSWNHHQNTLKSDLKIVFSSFFSEFAGWWLRFQLPTGLYNTYSKPNTKQKKTKFPYGKCPAMFWIMAFSERSPPTRNIPSSPLQVDASLPPKGAFLGPFDNSSSPAWRSHYFFCLPHCFFLWKWGGVFENLQLRPHFWNPYFWSHGMELIRLIFTIWENNGANTILKKIHFISPKNPCGKNKQPELKP